MKTYPSWSRMKALSPALAGSALVILIITAYEHSKEKQQLDGEAEAQIYWCRALAKDVFEEKVELHNFLATRCPASLLSDAQRR